MHIFPAETIVTQVNCDASRLQVSLSDGRMIAVPLEWFPRLKDATPAALKNWETAAAGHGIHWPELDEDISIEGLLFGVPSPNPEQSLYHK